MSSDNPSGAVNQQERPDIEQWAVGFVDGECRSFKERPLRTAKQEDFEVFCLVMEIMMRNEHLKEPGLRSIAALTEHMNRRQRSRYLESSEAIRQPLATNSEVKIWS